MPNVTLSTIRSSCSPIWPASPSESLSPPGSWSFRSGRPHSWPAKRPMSTFSRDGRLRLGVGIGWNYVEYEALGQDFHTRGARQEEQIKLLRRLFTEPVVDFSGRFDRIDRASLVPKPTRSIPIWLGGSGEKAFDRAARVGDGFIFFGGGVDRAVASWSRLRERVGDLGRSVQGFGGEYVALSGADVGELTREIDAWREAGGTHVTVVTMGLGLDSVGSHIDYLAYLAGRLSVQ